MAIDGEWPVTGSRLAMEGRLSTDRIYELLASHRRRHLLACLYLYGETMGLPDIADQLIAWEHGRPGSELPDERLRVYTDLYHAHVPKLADSDVVSYNQTTDTVELAGQAPQIRPYLEQAERDLFVSPTDHDH